MPDTAHNLTPRTRATRADSVRPGHIVMESQDHPAVVVRVGRPRGKVRLWCRYVWQAAHESEWPMPDLDPDDAVRVARNL
jgi:hypothetical protein